MVFQGCYDGGNFKTSGRCYFKARRAGSICVGRGVTLFSSHRSNRVGLTNPTLIQTFENGLVEIGDHTGASSVVISARSLVRIGKNVKIGANVRILDHDFHSLDTLIRRSDDDVNWVKSKPVLIEDDVFIGTNAIILKGCHIGARSIVGAGALVAGANVPPDSVVTGNPASIRNKK